MEVSQILLHVTFFWFKGRIELLLYYYYYYYYYYLIIIN